MIRELSKFFALAVTVVFIGFSHGDEPMKESPEQRRERLRIAVQAICPVSGESLTSPSNPVKMTDPETKEVLYVCCNNCLKSKPEPVHLGKIRENFAKAQGHCLVMVDNEVSEKSKLGIVEGHAVFVCCPPCIKKMTSAPEKFLAKLDDLYEASLKK